MSFSNQPVARILTCSMARDVELFGLLARSVDDFVAPDIRHDVVVPGADLQAFRRFETPQRQIIAQEDVLPFRTFRVPGPIQRAVGSRRPIYVDKRLKTVRGWVLQQLLKIEMSRRADAIMILHMDSDVFFIRPFATDRCFTDGRPAYFRVEDAALSAEHQAWTQSARAVLGFDVTSLADRHYVENCIPWSCDIVRKMTARIESVNGAEWYNVLRGLPSLSEYFIYGQFVDNGGYEEQLAGSDRSFCLSYWPQTDGQRFSVDEQSRRLEPDHVAMAIQSTEALTVAERRLVYEQASQVG